jgi:hypothetical protein
VVGSARGGTEYGGIPGATTPYSVQFQISAARTTLEAIFVSVICNFQEWYCRSEMRPVEGVFPTA